MAKFKGSRFERYWHAIFEFGVFIKGFNGVWETGAHLVPSLRR